MKLDIVGQILGQFPINTRKPTIDEDTGFWFLSITTAPPFLIQYAVWLLWFYYRAN